MIAQRCKHPLHTLTIKNISSMNTLFVFVFCYFLLIHCITNVTLVGASIIADEAKEYYGEILNNSDGLAGEAVLEFRGAASGALCIYDGDMINSTITCSGSFSCYGQSFVDNSNSNNPSFWDCYGYKSCASIDTSINYYPYCEGARSCMNATINLTVTHTWAYLFCWGMGSCAFTKTLVEGNRSYAQGDSLLTLYGATFTSSGSNDDYSNQVDLEGPFAGYGMTFNCEPSDLCYMWCTGGPLSCFGAIYYCSADATCVFQDCDPENNEFCPILRGPGYFYHWKTITGLGLFFDRITRDDINDTYYFNYSLNPYYGLIEEWVSELVNEFIFDPIEIGSDVSVNTYYLSVCKIDCGDSFAGTNTTFNLSNIIDNGTIDCNVNNSNSNEYLCFTGSNAGRNSVVNFDSSDDEYVVLFDGHWAGDGTVLKNVNPMTHIKCRGEVSCYDMEIDNGMQIDCIGENSCIGNVMYNVKTVNAISFFSGSYSLFYNVSFVLALAQDALYYSTFYSNGDSSAPLTMTIIIAGERAGNETAVYCQGSDTCNIYCYGWYDGMRNGGEYNASCSDLIAYFSCGASATCNLYENNFGWIGSIAPTSMPSPAPTGPTTSPTPAPTNEPTSPTLIPTNPSSTPTESPVVYNISTLSVDFVLSGNFHFDAETDEAEERGGSFYSGRVLSDDEQETTEELIKSALIRRLNNETKIIYGDVSVEVDNGTSSKISGIITVEDTSLDLSQLIDFVENLGDLIENEAESNDDVDFSIDEIEAVESISSDGDGSTDGGDSELSPLMWMLIGLGCAFGVAILCGFMFTLYTRRKRNGERGNAAVAAPNDDGQENRELNTDTLNPAICNVPSVNSVSNISGSGAAAPGSPVAAAQQGQENMVPVMKDGVSPMANTTTMAMMNTMGTMNTMNMMNGMNTMGTMGPMGTMGTMSTMGTMNPMMNMNMQNMNMGMGTNLNPAQMAQFQQAQRMAQMAQMQQQMHRMQQMQQMLAMAQMGQMQGQGMVQMGQMGQMGQTGQTGVMANMGQVGEVTMELPEQPQAPVVTPAGAGVGLLPAQPQVNQTKGKLGGENNDEKEEYAD